LRRTISRAAAGVAIVLAATVIGVRMERSTAEASPSASARPAAGSAIPDVVAATVDGVVSIFTTTTVETSPFREEEAVSEGSGFVLDKSGRILTNHHVVEGASKIHVTFADGTKVHAKLLGVDPLHDLAVIKVSVKTSTLHPLTLGRSEAARLGDPVIAIGNPFGLERSVSAGIVSGLRRQITAPNGFTISDSIQTDAAINHGNSGGPLLDANGRVIGVNAQIADSGVDANVGVGFAVAINPIVRSDIAVLRGGGTVRHGWLGVALGDIDAILATSGEVRVKEGALITGIVFGGPGDKAGLRGGTQGIQVDGVGYCIGGDIVTAVDGQRVRAPQDLQAAVAARRPGETLTLTVVRSNGKKTTLKVKLGTQPTTAPEVTSGCQ
jgi:S1-C subfamily serine protease